MKNRQAEDLVNIGKIGSSVGLRGEVRVNLYSPDSNNLKEGKVLLLKHAGNAKRTGRAADGSPVQNELRARCTGVRLQNGKPVIRVEGISDRTAADTLRGMELYIFAEDLEELPAGEHYVRDIIGYKVIDIAGGGRNEIGVLHDVIQNTAQSILDVTTPEGRSVLIPAVDAFLKKIDDDNEVIEVELIPGFLDL